MPRPDKPINSGGRLDGEVSSSRAHTWTKHGGPESVDGFRGAPSSSTVEVTVDDVTIVETPAEAQPTKWERRATAAHIPDDEAFTPRVEPVREWVVLRTIEDRTYRRTDALTVVERTSEG